MALTIEQSMYSFLTVDAAAVVALAGVRGYPLIIPQGTDFPAWAYRQISGSETEVHSGQTGLFEARFQLEILADSYLEAKAVAAAMRAAFNGFTGVMGSGGATIQECWTENEFDGYGNSADRETVRLDVYFMYK